MGRYFNPATENAIVGAGGRLIQGRIHGELISQLQDGETIGMFIGRPAFNQVADVGKLSEFREFESQVGRWIVFRIFYAMPHDVFRW